MNFRLFLIYMGLKINYKYVLTNDNTKIILILV